MESKILEILQSLQDGQKRMEIRLDSMENKMGLMENKMDLMENKMDLMENKIGSIETRIDSIESQINENTQILKALEHKVDVIKAEQENIKHDIAHKKRYNKCGSNNSKQLGRYSKIKSG